MSSESVCQVAHSWVNVGSFHTHLFGVVLGKSAMETLTMIQQAFGDQSLSCAQVFQ